MPVTLLLYFEVILRWRLTFSFCWPRFKFKIGIWDILLIMFWGHLLFLVVFHWRLSSFEAFVKLSLLRSPGIYFKIWVWDFPLPKLAARWLVAGLLDGWLIIMPLSCKLRLARFSIKLKIQERAECGKMCNIYHPKGFICQHKAETFFFMGSDETLELMEEFVISWCLIGLKRLIF